MMCLGVFGAPQLAQRRDGCFLRGFSAAWRPAGSRGQRAELGALGVRLAASLPASHGHLGFHGAAAGGGHLGIPAGPAPRRHLQHM